MFSLWFLTARTKLYVNPYTSVFMSVCLYMVVCVWERDGGRGKKEKEIIETKLSVIEQKVLEWQRTAQSKSEADMPLLLKR